MPLSKILPSGVSQPTPVNAIINGNMNVAQRGVSSTGVDADGYYTCDRWKYIDESTGGQVTLTQDSSVPTGSGLSKSFKVDVTTADTSVAADHSIRVQQRIEGQNLQHFAKGTSDAKAFSLSFYVKSNLTGQFNVYLEDTDNSRAIAGTYSISSADTWEFQKVSFSADTTGAFTNDNAMSLVLHFFLAAGTNFTSGTIASAWQSKTNANLAVGMSNNILSSTSNDWAMAGVQLTAGSEHHDFIHESFAETEIKCFRYTQRLPHRDNSSGSGYANITTMGRNDGTTLHTGGIMLPVVMRTDATMTSSGSFRVHHPSAATAVTGLAIDDNFSTAGNLGINATVSSGLTAGHGSQLEQNNDPDAHILLSAEL